MLVDLERYPELAALDAAGPEDTCNTAAKTAVFTEFTQPKKPLSKHFKRGEDGKLAKPERGILVFGKSRKVIVKTIEELRDHIAGMNCHQAICSGVTEAEVATVVSKDKLEKLPGTVTRKKRNFALRQGEPGIFPGDIDFPVPGTPSIKQELFPEGLQWLSPAQFLDVLFAVIPEAAAADWLCGYSNSSGIYAADGTELAPLKNLRAYAIVKDASIIPVLAKALRKAFLAAGWAWRENGDVKCVIDTAPASWAGALNYAGPASLEKGQGLKQQRPEMIIRKGSPGGMLATPQAFLEKWGDQAAETQRGHRRPSRGFE